MDQVFGLATWFSAGAVLPQLVEVWSVEPATASLLSLGVNVGFMVGRGGRCCHSAGTHFADPSRVLQPHMLAHGSGMQLNHGTTTPF